MDGQSGSPRTRGRANWKEAVLRDPKSRHEGEDDGRPDIDPKGGSNEDGVRRRIVLGSALRAIAIGGIAAGGMIGCASTTRMLRELPDPDLPRGRSVPGTSRRRLEVDPEVESPAKVPGVLSRDAWTSARPNYRGMDRQKRLRYVTIHHDGLGKPLGSAGLAATKARLDLIRRSHVGKTRQWADIGYHYAIDRAGRIWECRPITYQGAHVRGHNEGNIGILVMGDFDLEKPSSGQLRALSGHVNALCLSLGIPKNQRGVRTHKEWPSAATACPGRHLQPKVSSLRARGFRA